MSNKSYFYTETAFIHQGDINYLHELVKASAAAGADGIKFQVIAEYNDFASRANPNYVSFQKTIFSKQEWEEVFALCKSSGLDVIYMPCDTKAAILANTEWRQYIRYIDIHPVNFIYMPTLEVIKEGGIDIILGMGGRTKAEVDDKLAFFGDQIKVLMFGHQAFPTQLHQSAIGKIPLLKNEYPNVLIGYADHSPYQSDWGRQLQSVAYMLGARIFEKHIALVQGEERFDYITSVSPAAIADMIKDIQQLDEMNVEFADITCLNESEVKYTSRQLKAVAARDMLAGEIVTPADVLYKMIESESGLHYLNPPVGKKLISALTADYPFTEDNLI